MARISQIELARKLNVNRSSVSRAVKNGRLTVGKDGLLDEDEARRQWYATQSPLPHHQANRARLDDLQTVKAQPETMGLSGSDLGAAEKIGLRLKLATMREREAKAEQANIDIDKQAKALVEMGEINYVLTGMGVLTSEAFEHLKSRNTSSLYAAAQKMDINEWTKFFHDCVDESHSDLSNNFQVESEKFLTGNPA